MVGSIAGHWLSTACEGARTSLRDLWHGGRWAAPSVFFASAVLVDLLDSAASVALPFGRWESHRFDAAPSQRKPAFRRHVTRNANEFHPLENLAQVLTITAAY